MTYTEYDPLESVIVGDSYAPGDVDHLLPEYEKLLAKIAATRAALKQELHHALTATAGTAE